MSRILGHKAVAGTIAVSGIYDRFDRLPEIRSGLAAWASYVEALVKGEERQAEIVAFSRRSSPPQMEHLPGRSGRSGRRSGEPCSEVSLPQDA